MINVAVAGAGGRMGQLLITACLNDAQVQLSGALVRSGHPLSGVSIDHTNIAYSADSGSVIDACDVLIDFSQPLASLNYLEWCVRSSTPVVIGTTGFDAAQKDQLREGAASVPLVLAANTSVGVNVCLELLATASRALGSDVDIEIIEAHHRHKVDAPSGTALRMGEAVATATGRDLAECAVLSREGFTGERKSGSIGFSTVRGGDIVGEHTVMFIGNGERIEITHRTSNRMNFAVGAVRAARWIVDQQAGFYDMHDVLRS